MADGLSYGASKSPVSGKRRRVVCASAGSVGQASESRSTLLALSAPVGLEVCSVASSSGAGGMEPMAEQEMPEQVGARAGGREAEELTLYNSDLVKLIFGSLDIQDLARCASVCAPWRAVSGAEDFWRTVNLENRHISPFQLLTMARRHPNIQRLGLQGTDVPESCFVQVARLLTRLEVLELGKGHLAESYFSIVATHLPRLRELRVSEAVLQNSSNVQSEVSIEHDGLDTLVVEHSRTTRLVVRGRLLTSLSLRCSHLASVGILCPQLLRLDVHGCQKLFDNALRLAITRLTTLRELDVAGNLPLTDETLREIAAACTALTSLDCSSCGALTLSSVRGLPQLRSLNLSHCDSLAPTTAQLALESFTALEALQLNGCGLLTHVQLNLPRLRSLSLANCRALTLVDVRTPALEKLSLSASDHPGGRSGCCALKTLCVASAAMARAAWAGLPALEALVLACPALEELELADCDALRDDVFRSLGDGAGGLQGFTGALTPGCPRLRVARLVGCEGLRSCSLSSSSLRALYLTGCKGLESVVLACPALGTLLLDDCDALEAAQLVDVNVHALALGTCPHLTSLSITGPGLQQLDLKGCGQLERLELDCPALQSLDATFCSQLGDDVLALALARRPPLRALCLSVCANLTCEGMGMLGTLKHLRRLDVSYTDVKNLEPVLATCPNLEALNLANCRALLPTALTPLLPASPGWLGSDTRGSPAATPGAPLALLRELDVSYCRLPPEEVARVLARGSMLTSLALSGCDGVTDALWPLLHVPAPGADGARAGTAPGGAADGSAASVAPQAHALRRLSAVGCKKLRSWCLGVLPAGGAVGAVAAAMGMPVEGWVEQPCALAGLASLRLGLSGVRTVALALPRLAALDLNNCCELRQLELRCPLLLRACFQGCRRVPAPVWEPLLRQCGELEQLDAQHASIPAATLALLSEHSPGLTVFRTPPQPELFFITDD